MPVPLTNSGVPPLILITNPSLIQPSASTEPASHCFFLIVVFVNHPLLRRSTANPFSSLPRRSTANPTRSNDIRT